MQALKAVFLVSLYVIGIKAGAQGISGKPDGYLRSLEAKNKAMGSVCVRKKGSVLYQKAFGYSSLNPKIKPDTLTRYRVGSVSKTFTAVIILQLAEEKKLKLSDSLSRFFPGWPNAGRISIEHLLRHQSGIHNFAKDGSEKYRHADPQNREDILAIFSQAETDFKPGSRTEYNNANYVVLSLIAENLDSLDFSSIVDKRIIEPLNLENAYVGGAINIEKGEAFSYYYKRGWKKNTQVYANTLMGAGAMVSSPSDLCRFMEALFGLKFFSQHYLDQMLSLQGNMGLGIFRYPFGSALCYGHSGSINAFQSISVYFPEEDLSFALCLNGLNMDMNEILIEVLRAFIKP
ncbi:MAG: serine hydrolase domain-containing protein [Owenweeksia sp.]